MKRVRLRVLQTVNQNSFHFVSTAYLTNLSSCTIDRDTNISDQFIQFVRTKMEKLLVTMILAIISYSLYEL